MDPGRLKSISLFSEMSDEEARRLATFATERSVAPGTRVLKEGDFSTHLVAVEEGTADVLLHGQLVSAVGAGDLIGEIGLLTKTYRTADVIATSPMRLIEISHWDIRRMSEATVSRIRELVQARTEADQALGA